MKVKAVHSPQCHCAFCDHLMFYPELPPLDPNWDGKWTLACNWLGPVVNGKAVIITKGFRTDGASIPRSLWAILGHPFSMPLLPYALAHDAEYGAELNDRDVCDKRFLEAMANSESKKVGIIAKQVGVIKRNLVYSGVRAGGWATWMMHDKDAVRNARKFCRLIGEEEIEALRSKKCL